jgi:hypothetical protein
MKDDFKQVTTVENIEQIIAKMEEDGDLREGDFFAEDGFECLSDDDLGFYQQACAFLVSDIIRRLDKLEKETEDYIHLKASIQTCKKGHIYYAQSPEYPCPWCIISKLTEGKNEDGTNKK